jgi:uncharacterized protein YecE (DUF72 family)
MQLFVGTSGYGYKEWKGAFYPAKLPAKEMLRYYGEQFSTVEMNNTFRRMPTASSMESLAQQVPVSFRFAVKAPQSITHFKRLKNIDEEIKQLLHATAALKKRQGPLLFQLPPNFKKDILRLEDFLRLVPKKTKAAFEFRHSSWFDEEVFDCLRKRSCALCIADTDDAPQTTILSTADWGYVRLRRDNYSAAQLRQWAKKIHSQTWNEAYVFFKHEDTGIGPKLATGFLKLAATAIAPST